MAEFIKIYPDKPDEKRIKQVVDCLKDGGLIIYPTDTVYGLGCDIYNAKAVERLCKLKNIKPEKANLSFVCSNLSHLSKFCKQIDSSVFRTLKNCLPGPYTFILPAAKDLPKYFKDKKTVGIRVPNNNICRSIVEALGNPIVSTSVYSENMVEEYNTDPELIYENMDKLVDIVIDGGFGNNVASSVISLTEGYPEVLREGAGPCNIF